MLRYVILLNIHEGCTSTFGCWLLFPWQGTQPAVLQLFPRYSVDIYKWTNASELISLSRSQCGLQKLWTTPVHVHIATATEVIQLPHSREQACFIIEVWLVTLRDENALASNRPCNVCMTMLMMSKWWQHVLFKLHCQRVRMMIHQRVEYLYYGKCLPIEPG